MKKYIFAVSAVSILAMANAYAASVPQDQSLTLDIIGEVTGSSVATPAACTVVADQGGSVVLNSADQSSIINQGENGTLMTKVGLHVYGVRGMADCYDVIQSGRIALKFAGQQDNAQGTVLANSGTATGVGIGIYNYNTHQPININVDTLEIDKNTSTYLGLQSVKLSGQDITSGTMKGALTVEIERL